MDSDFLTSLTIGFAAVVDSFIAMSPVALYADLGVYSILCVGVLTLFYTGLLDRKLALFAYLPICHCVWAAKILLYSANYPPFSL
jgi:hypothetical protein